MPPTITPAARGATTAVPAAALCAKPVPIFAEPEEVAATVLELPPVKDIREAAVRIRLLLEAGPTEGGADELTFIRL